MPKTDYRYICLVEVLIDFVIWQDESYDLQMFLKKCKWIKKSKKIKIIRYIIDDLKSSSDDFDKVNSHKEDTKIIILTMMSFLRMQFI